MRSHRPRHPCPHLYTRSCLIAQCTYRHRQKHPAHKWTPRDVSRARTYYSWIPSNMGHLLCGVRRYQNQIWGSSPGSGSPKASRQGSISSSASERIPASDTGTPLGTPYTIRHACRCNKHRMHQPTLGNQDTVHGAFSPSQVAHLFRSSFSPRLLDPKPE